MSWPGYHARDGQSAATAWPAPTLPRRRHPRGEADASTDHTDSLSSSVRGPAGDSSARPARLQRLTREFLVAKRAGGDLWRRRCQILLEIKREELWVGQGDRDFDGWCQRVLGLGRGAVTKMLGIAIGPIGGERRRGPGGQPASRAGEGRPEPEVEKQSTASQPPAQTERVATGPDFVAWATRQLAQLKRRGMGGRMAGLSRAERTQARQVFAELSGLFAWCARAVAAEEEDVTDA